MQGFPLEDYFPPFPPSPKNSLNEGAIDKSMYLEMESVAHPDCQVGGLVETIEKGFLSPKYTPFY